MKLSVILTLAALAVGTFPAGASADIAPPTAVRQVTKQIVVPAPAQAVWSAWTSDEGLHSFFTEDGRFTTNIALKPDGDYEFFFYPDAPVGLRGTEGGKILGYEPGRMLAFTWRNRPDNPEVRPHRTSVIVYFEPLSERETRVTVIQSGWGTSPAWDKAYAYFDQAWAGVLDRLRKRFAARSAQR